MTVSLIAVEAGELASGKPLPWNLYDAGGRLLAEQGSSHTADSLKGLGNGNGLFRMDTAESSAAQTDSLNLEHFKLDPGAVLQLQTQHERYQVRVIGYLAPVSLLVTTPVLQGKLVFIKEGQQLLVRGFVGKDAVAYKTRVLKSQLSPYPYLHLAYPETVQSMRIRSSARISVDLVSALYKGEQQFAGRIVDLSVGGARITTPTPMAAVGDELRLAFKIRPAGQEVYVKCRSLVRAVRADEEAAGHYILGVEFLELEETDRLYLTNLIYQHLLKDNL